MSGRPIRPIEIDRVKLALKVLAVIIIAHGLFALLSYSRLPDIIPMHFDAAGKPDGFFGTTLLSWSLLWIVSTIMAVLLAWASLTLDRIPTKYLGMPKKEEFLSLDETARSRILGILAFHVIVFDCALALFFFILHGLTALAAFGVVHTLPIIIVYGGTAALTIHGIAIAFVSIGAVNRELDGRKT